MQTPIQFKMDEDRSTPSPIELIDISSDSNEQFTVETADVMERFRIGGPPTTNLMTAFMRAATASLYPENGSPQEDDPMQIDTRGSSIETELYSLMGELPNLSPISFFGSSDEDAPSLETTKFANVERNDSNRPSNPAVPTSSSSGVIRPIPLYPNGQQYQSGGPGMFMGSQMPYQMLNLPNQAYPVPPNYQIPTYPVGWLGQIGFAQAANVDLTARTHEYLSTSYDPQHPGQLYPPVMPNVAGYCHWCGKTFDQIAVETLVQYVQHTEYPEETARDRNLRWRAFTDGFEAALICFKTAGLSQPGTCVGTDPQQEAGRGFQSSH